MSVFNDNEMKKAKEKLLEIIHRDGDINTCGVFGIRYIYHILADMGETDLALKIILSTERSCYGHWILKGATALCESFEEFDSQFVNSRNHHFFGDISSWFIQNIAGLKPNPYADDVTYYEIAPKFPDKLNFAEAGYKSVLGETSVKWMRLKNGKIELSIKVPQGIHANVIMPKNYCLENGTTELKADKSITVAVIDKRKNK